MADEQINFFSSDPVANPLLDVGLRPGVFTAWLVVLGIIFIAAFSYASFCDLWRGRLTPNWFTEGTIAFAILAGPLMFENWVTHFVIGGVVAVILLGFWHLSGGIGMGDVKLFTGLCLLFGPAGVMIVALAQFLAVPVSVPIAILSRRGRKLPVVMFPFTAAATLIVLYMLGADTALVLAGAGILGLACLAGLFERRLWPPARIEALAAPVLAGECEAVRLRAGERPLQEGENGRWLVPDGGGSSGRPVRRRDLEILSASLLDVEQIEELDRVGEVGAASTVGAVRVALRFSEGPSGYTLDVRRSGSAATAPDADPLAA